MQVACCFVHTIYKGVYCVIDKYSLCEKCNTWWNNIIPVKQAKQLSGIISFAPLSTNVCMCDRYSGYGYQKRHDN